MAAVFAESALDAVVHLAGNPEETGLPASFTSHVVTTAALLDAMVEHDVTRIVYASSNHAVGRTPHRDLVSDDACHARTRSTASARSPPRRCSACTPTATASTPSPAGSGRSAPGRRPPATWPPGSPTTTACGWSRPRSPHCPGFAVLYGISANTRAWWDLEPGRRLGYEPQDDAEEFAAAIEPRAEDDAEAAYVGGVVWGCEEFHRPALERT